MKRAMFAAGVTIILLLVLSNISDSQIVWQRSPMNPVVKAAGGFSSAFEPSVLYDSVHGCYDMWFTGKNRAYTSSFAIYHARSTDGATWLVDATGPVLYPDTLGSYDSDLRGPCVIRDNAGYKMYFLAQAVAGLTIGVATSANGTTWTKYAGNPILSEGPSGSWESQVIAYPAVVFEETTYYMWYEGFGDNRGAIGLATSTDGFTWTRCVSNPVMQPSGTGWDSLGTVQPAVVKVNGIYYMLFDKHFPCCSSTTGFATSSDRIHWMEYVHNPVFVQGSPGAWDDQAVATGSVVFLQDTFHFWYTGLSASTGQWQTGYAISLLGAVPPPPRMALHVEDAGSGNAVLQFGTMPGATDGLDTAFGERDLPPKPPKGDFDARWLIAGTQGSLIDLEDTLGGDRLQNEYAGIAQPGPDGFPITLQWDPDSLPSGSFELVDQASYGGGYKVNMRVQNTFALSDTSPQPFVIVYNNTPSFVGSVSRAWNMISLPLTVTNRSVQTLFPTASSKAFAYNGSYVPVDSLAYGVGYWIKFDTVQNISISGSLITTDTPNVVAGWNMIGAISAPTPVGDIIQIPANNVVSQYFGYQAGYRTVASLLPMRAYWVKANSDGKLVLNGSSNNAALRLVALPQDDAGLSRLDITDAKGNAATLYVASRLEVGNRFDASQYVAPPAPPVGAFDARFGGDQLAALYEVGRTGPQQYEIDIQAAYPVKISWNFPHAGPAAFALLDAATGKEIAPSMGGTGSVLVTNKAVNKLYFVVNTGVKADVPRQFALEQNYPNPFNPTTIVQYALPKDAFVTLKVYSLVGQEVATLVQGRQSVGYHTAMWDASKAPSGVYFCHMAAGPYTAVRKMVLVK